MIWVSVAVGILAVPVILEVRSWRESVLEERQELGSLVEQARSLPQDPDAFGPAEARRAVEIIDRAWSLPSVLPNEVPELRALTQRLRHRADHTDRVRSDGNRAAENVPLRQVAVSRDERPVLFSRALALLVRNPIMHSGAAEGPAESVTERPWVLTMDQTDIDAASKVETPQEHQVRQEVERVVEAGQRGDRI